MSQQLDPAIFGDRPKNLCRIEGCTRKRVATRTFCAAHFARHQKGRPMDTPIRPWNRRTAGWKKNRPMCGIPGCWHPVKTFKSGLCSAHYRRKLEGRPVSGVIQEHRPTGTVVEVNPRIHKSAAALLERRARDLGTTRAGLARRILEDWAKDEQARGGAR